MRFLGQVDASIDTELSVRGLRPAPISMWWAMPVCEFALYGDPTREVILRVALIGE